MPDVSINPKNHIGCDGDVFVGMKFVSKDDGKSSSVEAIFPLGYRHSGKDNKGELKKELYALLCTIKRHSKNKDDNLNRTKTDTEKKEFPFDAYIAVIRDFMQYGYYIEREIKYKRSPLGKINWKRTIAQVRPIIQDDGSPIYTDFVIRQTTKKNDNLISLIHKWCVYEAFTTFGWLFTTFNPHESTLKIGDDNKNYFISIIHDSLKSTFNDRNRTLFKAMIAMLRYGGVGGKEPFFYGTTHFHTVWEGLIDTFYGIPKSEKRKFFPGAEWCFLGTNKPIPASSIRPDTIMLPNGDAGEVFVLDAKYYYFTEDEKHVPAASDINKQVEYGAYAAQKTKRTVYNAFLMPYDFKRDQQELKSSVKKYPYIYIGYARFVKEEMPTEKPKRELESYELVLGILIDAKWLMENIGKIDKKELADFIIESYKKAESHNNKAE
jgi:hypothetical protein